MNLYLQHSLYHGVFRFINHHKIFFRKSNLKVPWLYVSKQDFIIWNHLILKASAIDLRIEIRVDPPMKIEKK